MSNHLLVAVSLFSLSYIAIISEKINRMIVAMLGAVLMIGFQVLSQEEAFSIVDFNTIGLLIGMMVIVNILKRTGFFQYLAIKMAKAANGDPWKIVFLFALTTTVSSAFLDNVTTVLLLAPVTFVIADTLKMNPIPFMVPMIFASNIGGTSTIIGDATTIMIGSATNFDFVYFLKNMAPICALAFAVMIVAMKLIYGKSLVATDENRKAIFALDESKTISDMGLLKKCLAILAMTIIGFIFHKSLHLESATVALGGAMVLLLLSKLDPEEILMEIEWNTIFFFIGLFILVGSLVKVGVIGMLAEQIVALTNGNLYLTAMLILWVAAILSSILDNVPFVATMIPLLQSMEKLTGTTSPVVWFALAAGACLGGNGTLIGASCNVIIGGMLEKRNHKIGFINYMKIAYPTMLLSIAAIAVYITVIYF